MMNIFWIIILKSIKNIVEDISSDDLNGFIKDSIKETEQKINIFQKYEAIVKICHKNSDGATAKNNLFFEMFCFLVFPA